MMQAKLFAIKKRKDKKAIYAKQLIPKGTIVCFESKKDKVYSKKQIDEMLSKRRKFILAHAYKRKD